MVGNTAAEKNKEKTLKQNKDRLRDIWDKFKGKNIHIIGVTDGEKKGLRKHLKIL